MGRRAAKGNRAVSDAGQRAVPLAQALAPQTFFQSAHADDESALVLAFTDAPSDDLRHQLEAAAAPARVTFRIVAHSWPQLEAVMDRISADLEMWAARGGHITVWGPDWASNKVQISLAKHMPEVANAIEVHYGRHLVEVSNEPANPMLL